MIKRSIVFVFLAFSLFFLKSSVQAQSLDVTIEKYDVVISINEDSSFDVKETITYNSNGFLHGHRRGITLDDPNKCEQAGQKLCGTYDSIAVNGAFQNGKRMDESDGFTTYVTTDATGSEYFVFEWEIFADGKDVTYREDTWEINYTIYGGISWEDVFGSELPIFYWNIYPENRQSAIKNSTVTINFPSKVKLDQSDLQTYNDFGFKYDVSFQNNSIKYNILDSSIFGTLTVQYVFNSKELIKPAALSYKINDPVGGNKVYLNGSFLSSEDSYVMNFFPTGDQELLFKHFGYKDKYVKVNLQSGEYKEIEVTLEPTPWLLFARSLGVILMLIGLCIAPVAALMVVFNYFKKGRDIKMPQTIIPIFNPPVSMAPYLLGSIKDEKVDRIDIVGTIIDLAYKGYLTITELESSNYQLTRKVDADTTKITSIEKFILDSIFSSSDTVTTNTLNTKSSLATNYHTIENKIYTEMVSFGYFDKSPRSVREINAGIGIVMVILGVFSIIPISAAVTTFLSMAFIFTPSLILIAAGIANIIFSYFMPAKTEKGSKVFAEILGFKMYMETAERYRVQNLKPEDFHKYLSYAIVFGIEKKWAEQFKGIDIPQADWYQGNTSLTDAVLVSSFARNFSTSTVSHSMPVSSSSTGSSGWSGSFSSGGFSGGGGGGGFSSSW